MKRCVQAYISVGLFNALKEEKRKLQLKEKNKRKRKRKNITFWDASQSIVGRVR